MADTLLSSYPELTLTHVLGHDGSLAVGKLAVADLGGGATVLVSDTAPDTGTTPVNSLWWESDTGIMYILYDDLSSVQWVAVGESVSGDVFGPGSSTDDHIAVFDGITGKLLKDGGVAIADIAGSPGGTTDQVQYNNAGVFAGMTGSTVSGSDLTITGRHRAGSYAVGNGASYGLMHECSSGSAGTIGFGRSDTGATFIEVGIIGGGAAGGAIVAASSGYFWSPTVSGTPGLAAGDIGLRRQGAGLLAQVNAANPQAFRVYKTSDSPTAPAVYERGVFDWTTQTDVLTIGTQKDAGGVTVLRAVNIVGSALTFNGSAIGGSTSPGGSGAELQYNSGGSFGAVAGSVVTAAGGLTLNNGAVATNLPVLSVTQTWSGGGPSYIALDVNVPSSSTGGAAARLLKIRSGSSEFFGVDGNGTIGAFNFNGVDASGNYVCKIESGYGGGTPGVFVSSIGGGGGGRLRFQTGHVWGGTISSDIAYQDAGILGQSNGANPQAYRIYNTTDDLRTPTTYSRIAIKWVSNVGYILPEASGTLLPLIISTGAMLVGSLPAPSAALSGARAMVTDATVNTFLATVSAGGGSNVVPVFCDGTVPAWKVG